MNKWYQENLFYLTSDKSRIQKLIDHYEIYKKKRDMPVLELCKDIPIEFAKFMKYSRELKFSEKPDYQYLVNLMEHCLKKEDYDGNKVFDWNIKLDKQSK